MNILLGGRYSAIGTNKGMTVVDLTPPGRSGFVQAVTDDGQITFVPETALTPRGLQFSYEVVHEDDDQGWYVYGHDTYGRFCNKQDGAIPRNRRTTRHEYKYFMPVSDEYGQQYLARAEAYGLEWCYQSVAVNVVLNGVTIAHAILHGVECDTDLEADVLRDLRVEATIGAVKWLTSLI